MADYSRCFTCGRKVGWWFKHFVSYIDCEECRRGRHRKTDQTLYSGSALGASTRNQGAAANPSAGAGAGAGLMLLQNSAPLAEIHQRMMMQQNVAQMILGYSPPVAPIPPVPVTPLKRDDMQVCDLIGWRAWRITPTGYLQSAAVETVWLPGDPMIGEVGDHNGRGVHAYKTRNDAMVHAMQGGRVALGSVLLWGDVVEHERGYRAERAKIHSIDDVTWDAEPPWSETIAKAIAFLRKRYGLSGE